MEYEVYADLLFLVNFSMDFLGFYLCAQLLHRPLRLWRGVVAAALGAIYAVIALFFSLAYGWALLIDATVCVVLCCIAMRSKGEHFFSLLRLSAIYLLISALLGGVMTLLSSQLNRTVSPDALVSDEPDGFGIFSVLASLAAAAVLLLCRLARRTRAVQTVTLRIAQGDRTIAVPALCDSGNLLRDPISARPVIPIDLHTAKRIVPAPILHAATAERPSDAIVALPPSLARRIRLIPGRSATDQASRYLLAWQADCICLERGKAHREVAAYLAPLPLDTSDRGFCAIIPSELIE